MTIAVCLKCMDGIVLAADSASTLGGPDGIANVYDNANKIVNLRKGLPVGIVFWGAGAIGESSMTTLAKDLRVRFSDDQHHEWHLDPVAYTIQGVAEKTIEFLRDEHYSKMVDAMKALGAQQDPPVEIEEWPSLGFFVAGYSAGAHHAECWEVAVDENGDWIGPIAAISHDTVGTQWRGQPEWISRLLIGFSGQLPAALVEDFDVPEADLDNVMSVIRARTEITLLHPAMPIQDAIDLARFLVDMTKAVSRFAQGAPTVGGPTEIAAITKHEGFKWVTRKHYFDKEFNPSVEAT